VNSRESYILEYIKDNEINILFFDNIYCFFINNSIKMSIDKDYHSAIENIIKGDHLVFLKDIRLDNKIYKVYGV
jgi:hypothetical protein